MSFGNFTSEALPSFFEPKNDYTYLATGAVLLAFSAVQYYNMRKRDVGGGQYAHSHPS